MFRRLLAVFAVASSALPAAAHAQRVLYWADVTAGTSAVPSALRLLQGTRPGMTSYQAASQTDFNARLGSGNYDLAMFGEQGGQVYSQSAAALESFLNAGGTIIGATWTGSGLAQLLGAASVVSSNGASLTGSGALFDGLDGAIALANSRYGIFAQGYALAAGSTCAATLASGGCGAVVGNDGRTLLVAPLFDTYTSTQAGGRFLANGVGLVSPTSTVPEPGSVALVGAGLAGVVGLARRRRAAA